MIKFEPLRILIRLHDQVKSVLIAQYPIRSGQY